VTYNPTYTSALACSGQSETSPDEWVEVTEREKGVATEKLDVVRLRGGGHTFRHFVATLRALNRAHTFALASGAGSGHPAQHVIERRPSNRDLLPLTMTPSPFDDAAMEWHCTVVPSESFMVATLRTGGTVSPTSVRMSMMMPVI